LRHQSYNTGMDRRSENAEICHPPPPRTPKKKKKKKKIFLKIKKKKKKKNPPPPPPPLSFSKYILYILVKI